MRIPRLIAAAAGLLAAAAAPALPPSRVASPQAAAQTPGPAAEPAAFERVRYLVDASGSMRARFGAGTRLRAASEMLLALERELDRGGTRPEPDLWTFGASSHRLERDCRDVERRGWPPGGAAEAVGALVPTGLSPLVLALDRMRAARDASPPTAAGGAAREAWVVFTDGSDGCGRDPCEWAAHALAAPDRPRLYVVGLGLSPDHADELRCLADAASGYLLEIEPGAGGEAPIRRLASVIRNRGTLRLELPPGLPANVSVNGRVFRTGAGEPLRTVRSGRDEELPGGMYRVVAETVPATTFDRVLVLPGGDHVLRLRDVGALLVRVLGDDNGEVPARVGLLPLGGDTVDEHVVPGGTAAAVRAGRYRVTAETGDSTVVLRREVEVERGTLHTMSAGGTGFLQSRASGLAAFPRVPVELVEHASAAAAPTTVFPWDAAVPLPAGGYRVRVGTLPPYVQEELAIAAAETTRLSVPGLGLLRVDVRDADGRPVVASVSLLRPGGGAPPDGEALPPAVLGTFLPGVPQAVLAGTYDILLGTRPEIVERGIRVTAGGERTVSVIVPLAADRRVR